MPALALADPLPSDGVPAARAGFARVDAPLVQRPECDHLPDLFTARLRGG